MDEVATVRTACHGCRQVTHFRSDEDVIRPMVLPASGTVWVDKAQGGMVEVPCPVCGDDEDPGWVDGFVPPV